MQKASPTWPEGDDNRAEVLIEFMNNWLVENVPEMQSVSPKDRLTATWGGIKNQ
ncbi:hypothetical protein H8E77_32880 [bacterium]|nr:hypothetical protein [bacterium]